VGFLLFFNHHMRYLQGFRLNDRAGRIAGKTVSTLYLGIQRDVDHVIAPIKDGWQTDVPSK
jgi:hypothetical protein